MRLLCLLWPHPEACLSSYLVALHLFCLLCETFLMLALNIRQTSLCPASFLIVKWGQ